MLDEPDAEEEPSRRHVTLNVFGVSGRRVTLGAVGGRVLLGGRGRVVGGDSGGSALSDGLLLLWVVAVGVEADWIKIAGLKMSLYDGSEADFRT